MRKSKKITIIIPAYNEASVIKSVIKEIKAEGFKRILVVDDGSRDETEAVARQFGAGVVRHILNRGKGAAVKTGLEAAKLMGTEIAVTFDGDGQHDPKDITKLIAALGKRYDIALGCRLHNANNVPFIKVIANHLGNFFVWLIYGLWVRDSQSGFRAYTNKALSLIETRHDQYEFDSEVIREISRNKIAYIEVPIKVRYTKYAMAKVQKQSFINGLKTLFRLVISS